MSKVLIEQDTIDQAIATIRDCREGTGGVDTYNGEPSELDITLTAATGLNVTVRATNTLAGSTMTINWGDGVAEDIAGSGTKAITHSYTATGNYTISIDSTGTYALYGSASSPYNMFNSYPAYFCTEARLGIRCTSVANYACSFSYSLKKVIISPSVSLLTAAAFGSSMSVMEYIILSNTPPTAQNPNVFSGINGLCKIKVPQGSLATYQTATNWATYANYMIEMTDEEMLFYGLGVAT